jgi:hypothetical protein
MEKAWIMVTKVNDDNNDLIGRPVTTMVVFYLCQLANNDFFLPVGLSTPFYPQTRRFRYFDQG